MTIPSCLLHTAPHPTWTPHWVPRRSVRRGLRRPDLRSVTRDPISTSNPLTILRPSSSPLLGSRLIVNNSDSSPTPQSSALPPELPFPSVRRVSFLTKFTAEVSPVTPLLVVPNHWSCSGEHHPAISGCRTRLPNSSVTFHSLICLHQRYDDASPNPLFFPLPLILTIDLVYIPVPSQKVPIHLRLPFVGDLSRPTGSQGQTGPKS